MVQLKTGFQRKIASKKSFQLALIISSIAFLGCSEDAVEFEWRQLASGSEAHLYGVHFVDAKRGWAVGTDGVVLSTDNGANWASTSIAKNALTQVHFTTPNNGWIVSIGTVLYTGSGGISWKAQNANVKQGLLDLHFVSTTEGWGVGGKGTILHTETGGLRWEHQRSSSDKHLWGVHFVDNLHGWIVGEEGEVLYTKNRGKQWIPQQSGVEQPLFRCPFRHSQARMDCRDERIDSPYYR